MTAHDDRPEITFATGGNYPYRPTDPPCPHVATVPIRPIKHEDATVTLRRCLNPRCQAEVVA
jgi:hypothetical protein